MPVTPTYPGVYIEELPSGVRTIVGVATSITAFVGRTRRGPADEPTIVNNHGDFERVFGGLWEGSKLPYAVRDYFLNGGANSAHLTPSPCAHHIATGDCSKHNGHLSGYLHLFALFVEKSPNE